MISFFPRKKYLFNLQEKGIAGVQMENGNNFEIRVFQPSHTRPTRGLLIGSLQRTDLLTS
jgi:hypothetical protein